MRKRTMILTLVAAAVLIADSWTAGLTYGGLGASPARSARSTSTSSRPVAKVAAPQLMQPGLCVVVKPITPTSRRTCSEGDPFWQVADAPTGSAATVTIATTTDFCKAAGDPASIRVAAGRRFSCESEGTTDAARVTALAAATDFCQTPGGDQADLGSEVIFWGCAGIPTAAEGEAR
jgi:hypothetical protein